VPHLKLKGDESPHKTPMISQEEIVRTTKNRKEETNSIIAEVENLQMDTLQLDDVLGQVEL